VSSWQIRKGRFDAIVSDGEHTTTGKPYVFVSDAKLGNALLELDWEDVKNLRLLLCAVHDHETERVRKRT
jgi:hypothetical protein